jgi:cell cycle checkpoint protein
VSEVCREQAMSEMDEEAADVICELENVQGLVDALTAVRWKRHQDAVLELSEHGIVLIVEESGCLQAKVYLKKEVESNIHFLQFFLQFSFFVTEFLCCFL